MQLGQLSVQRTMVIPNGFPLLVGSFAGRRLQGDGHRGGNTVQLEHAGRRGERQAKAADVVRVASIVGLIQRKRQFPRFSKRSVKFENRNMPLAELRADRRVLGQGEEATGPGDPAALNDHRAMMERRSMMKNRVQQGAGRFCIEFDPHFEKIIDAGKFPLEIAQ